MTLPTDNAARKALPLFTFLTEYFPDAILALVEVSVAGNIQHNPELAPVDIQWAREKSTDHLNTAQRHLWDHATSGPLDTDGQRHLAKAAWRALAQLQLDIEESQTKVPFEALKVAGIPGLLWPKADNGWTCACGYENLFKGAPCGRNYPKRCTNTWGADTPAATPTREEYEKTQGGAVSAQAVIDHFEKVWPSAEVNTAIDEACELVIDPPPVLGALANIESHGDFIRRVSGAAIPLGSLCPCGRTICKVCKFP